MSADTPRRLGRGLEALISTAKQQRESSSAQHAADRPEAGFQMLAISEIRPNQFQPRRYFSEPELEELQASIKASGLLQPITVRRSAQRGWELVTGERRLRAATRIGWTEIPAIVREFDDRAMLTLALVENLQRADLNALEEAHLAAVHVFMPGMRLERTGETRHCQGTVLADWVAHGPDGAERERGTNVFGFDADGRIADVVGVWNPPGR